MLNERLGMALAANAGGGLPLGERKRAGKALRQTLAATTIQRVWQRRIDMPAGGKPRPSLACQSASQGARAPWGSIAPPSPVRTVPAARTVQAEAALAELLASVDQTIAETVPSAATDLARGQPAAVTVIRSPARPPAQSAPTAPASPKWDGFKLPPPPTDAMVANDEEGQEQIEVDPELAAEAEEKMELLKEAVKIGAISMDEYHQTCAEMKAALGLAPAQPAVSARRSNGPVSVLGPRHLADLVADQPHGGRRSRPASATQRQKMPLRRGGGGSGGGGGDRPPPVDVAFSPTESPWASPLEVAAMESPFSDDGFDNDIGGDGLDGGGGGGRQDDGYAHYGDDYEDLDAYPDCNSDNEYDDHGRRDGGVDDGYGYEGEYDGVIGGASGGLSPRRSFSDDSFSEEEDEEKRHNSAARRHGGGSGGGRPRSNPAAKAGGVGLDAGETAWLKRLHSALSRLQVECGDLRAFRGAVGEFAAHMGDLLEGGVNRVEAKTPRFDQTMGKYPASRDCFLACGFKRERGCFVYPAEGPLRYDQTSEGSQAVMRLLVGAVKAGSTPPLQKVMAPVLSWKPTKHPKRRSQPASSAPPMGGASRERPGSATAAYKAGQQASIDANALGAARRRQTAARGGSGGGGAGGGAGGGGDGPNRRGESRTSPTSGARGGGAGGRPMSPTVLKMQEASRSRLARLAEPTWRPPAELSPSPASGTGGGGSGGGGGAKGSSDLSAIQTRQLEMLARALQIGAISEAEYHATVSQVNQPAKATKSVRQPAFLPPPALASRHPLRFVPPRVCSTAG